MIDPQGRALIVAHIESMNSLTKAITLQSAAILEQSQVIGQLVDVVGALIETGVEQDDEDRPAPTMTLMNGDPIN